MYYSITWDVDPLVNETCNSYDTWHLIPTERPSINPPPQKIKTVDIPGANGSLNLSTSLTGYPVFNNRTGSIEFIVENDHGHWQDIYTNIMETLHGKTLYASMEEDPGWSYIGTWSVNQWKSDKYYSKITLDYDLQPYKKRMWQSTSGWLWDPFNFNNGVVTLRSSDDYSGFRKNINTDNWDVDSIVYIGQIFSSFDRREIVGSEPVIPTINITRGPITVRFTNQSTGLYAEATLDEGTHVIPEFVITDHASMQIDAIGNGYLMVTFTPGRM